MTDGTKPIEQPKRKLSAALRKLRAQTSPEAPSAQEQVHPNETCEPVAAAPASLSPEFQRILDEQPRAKKAAGSQALPILRAARAARENRSFTETPGFEQLDPAARVTYETARLSKLRQHADESRTQMVGQQNDLTRIELLITAERVRLAAHDTAVHQAALAGSELPDAAPSKLPALERAKADTEAKLAAATQAHELDERAAQNRSRLEQAQRAVTEANAREFAAAKIAPLVAELKARLATAPGKHVFNVGADAPLTIEVASPDEPPPVIEFRVGSVHLQKLRAQRAAKEAAVAS